MAIFLISLSCENPFFPDTGTPQKTFSFRSTPEGVLKQLILSYESKRLDLYKELLSDSFQFYVAPSFISSYATKYVYEFEGADPNLTFVSGTKFYYWTKKEEEESHRKLLQDGDGKVKEIRYISSPVVSKIRYKTIDNDTVNVEMMITGGELLIQLSSMLLTREYLIAIEKQVFWLERDKTDDKLWVIRKWYDMSNAPSD